MKALKIIGIILLILIGIILLGGLVFPKKVEIEKSIYIKASAQLVFEQVSDFKKWEPWSPWQDSLIVNSYEGESGVGHKQSWTHEKMGDGEQVIIEYIPFTFIRTELSFDGRGKTFSNWSFTEEADSVKVTWTFESEESYPFGRWIGAVLVKPMVAKSYVKGLAKLKEVVETMEIVPQGNWKVGEIIEMKVKSGNAISIKDSCTTENIGAKMEEHMGELMAFTKANNIECIGPPFSIWHKWNPEGYSQLENAMPVKGNPKLSGRLSLIKTYGGNVVMASHFGPYETSEHTWNALEAYIKDKGKEIVGSPWEVYITDPTTEPDQSKWETQVFFPVK